MKHSLIVKLSKLKVFPPVLCVSFYILSRWHTLVVVASNGVADIARAHTHTDPQTMSADPNDLFGSMLPYN